MYLLDSNTYIEAKNRYYQMSFCPAYWDWLDQQYQLGILSSITSVYDELANNGDELSDWVKDRRDQFHSVATKEIQIKMTEVAQHVVGLPNKNPVYVNGFLGKADPWLVAKASLTGETIVTHEILVEANSKKVKIPNICNYFDVPYINTFELLRTLEANFMLDKSAAL